jgi:hypothetical protein
MTFNGSGCSDNVGAVNFTWTFQDRAPIALFGVHPDYTFDNPGVFIVTLNVTDAAGNRGTDTMKITVIDITPPVADAGQDQKVPVGSTIILNGSQSTDNIGIGKYTWNFTYDGKTKSLEGNAVSFTFSNGGAYEIVLSVFDLAGNSGNDKVLITVVDTGRITGTVLDRNNKPIGGATVEITSSNGMTCATKTGDNGTFSIEIYHGPFTWSITKSGYRKISGNDTVDPMKDARLDLSDHPLKKVEKESPFALLPMLALIIVIAVAAAGAGLFLYMKRKKGPARGNSG